MKRKKVIAARKSFYIVGVGASAGGLLALEQFFANMPSDCGMAFVVVQHLDPDRQGMLVELLHDIAVLQGVPIDFFFKSVAGDCQRNGIGVLLSGMGSDGTRGLRAIRQAGGATFVQTPTDAQFDNMPRSAIDANLADVTAPAPELSADAKHVLQTLVFQQRDVPAARGRWFRVRTMPYRTQDNRIDGLVITFFDLTASKELEAKLESAQRQLAEFQVSVKA